MRELTSDEIGIIEGIANLASAAEREAILADLAIASVTEEDETAITFGLRDYSRPRYVGQRPYSAEVRLRDVDGAELTAILYHDQGGRLFELEIIRWDGDPVRQPDPSSIARLSRLGSVVEGRFGKDDSQP